MYPNSVIISEDVWMNRQLIMPHYIKDYLVGQYVICWVQIDSTLQLVLKRCICPGKNVQFSWIAQIIIKKTTFVYSTQSYHMPSASASGWGVGQTLDPASGGLGWRIATPPVSRRDPPKWHTRYWQSQMLGSTLPVCFPNSWSFAWSSMAKFKE